MTLEDRIYCLQRTPLPELLHDLVAQADVYYIQGQDGLAFELVSRIEKECRQRGISIYMPLYAPQ